MGQFSQSCSAFHLHFSGDHLWRSGAPSGWCALLSPPARWGAAGPSEPPCERLAMSKSCQEKSQIPPHGFGCSSPRCCLAGRWWRPAARLVAGMLFAPQPEAGAVSPLAPLGPEVTVLTQGRCLLINLPRDLCCLPGSAGESLKEGVGDTAFSWRRGQSRIPHQQVQAH